MLQFFVKFGDFEFLGRRSTLVSIFLVVSDGSLNIFRVKNNEL